MQQDEECAVRCVRGILSVWTTQFFPRNHLNAAGRGHATSQWLVNGGRYWQHPSAADQTCLMTAIISTLQICRSDYLDTAAAQLSPLTDINAASQLGSIAAIDLRWLSRKLGMATGYRSSISVAAKRYWPWPSQNVPWISGQWPQAAGNAVWLACWCLSHPATSHGMRNPWEQMHLRLYNTVLLVCDCDNNTLWLVFLYYAQHTLMLLLLMIILVLLLLL